MIWNKILHQALLHTSLYQEQTLIVIHDEIFGIFINEWANDKLTEFVGWYEITSFPISTAVYNNKA